MTPLSASARSDWLSAQARHEVVWAVRHDSIGDAFFDRDAVRSCRARATLALEALSPLCFQAAFLHGVLAARVPGAPPAAPRTAADALVSSSGGAAVGPDWVTQLQQLSSTEEADAGGRVRIAMHCELAALVESSGEWPLLATLTSGEALGVDVVIAATGVEPSVEWCVAAG